MKFFSLDHLFVVGLTATLSFLAWNSGESVGLLTVAALYGAFLGNLRARNLEQKLNDTIKLLKGK